MANKKRRCLLCKEYFIADEMIKIPAGCNIIRWFCGVDHAAEYAKNRHYKQQKASFKAQKTKKRKELRKRSYWYRRLQTLVNQYVRWRDRNEPCCTCGTTNPNIKYDAGHFHTKKARPDIRFELTNIHKQCSRNCNVLGSGMRNEYEKFIIEKYGSDHVEYLSKVRYPLKEQFPTWQDIEAEIVRYRELLRSVGIKPNE